MKEFYSFGLTRSILVEFFSGESQDVVLRKIDILSRTEFHNVCVFVDRLCKSERDHSILRPAQSCAAPLVGVHQKTLLYLYFK